MDYNCIIIIMMESIVGLANISSQISKLYVEYKRQNSLAITRRRSLKGLFSALGYERNLWPETSLGDRGS